MDPHKIAKSGSEHAHQTAYFQALLTWSPYVHSLTFAIPNGAALAERGKSPQARLTGAIRMSRLKAEGLKTGVPDVMVAWPLHEYHGSEKQLYHTAGLFLEFKKAAGGVIGEDQIAWRKRLEARGYRVRVVYNWQEGINATAEYFGQPKHYVDVGSGE